MNLNPIVLSMRNLPGGALFPTIGFCFVLVALASACQKPLPTLEGINTEQWKNDRNGCSGLRTAMIKTIEEQKNKLQGLSEMQVIDLLGRADQNELYKRNQKFYYYFLEPGKACGKDTEPRRLSVRFNATGLAKEISVE